MHPQTPFSIFRGLAISVVASALSVMVVYYFWRVSWDGTAPDFHLTSGGKSIPPESYPILLLTLWSLAQRANAHWGICTIASTLGKIFWWEDLLEGIGVAAFLGLTLFYTLKSGANITYIFVLISFIVQAFGGAFMDALHYFDGDVVTGDLRIAPGAYPHGFVLKRLIPGFITEYIFRDGQGRLYTEDASGQLVPLVATAPATPTI